MAQVTVQPTTNDDTIRSDSTSQNIGAGTWFGVQASSPTLRCLGLFDLVGSVPGGSTIDSATLSLYDQAHGSSPQGRTYWAYQLTTTDWAEGTQSIWATAAANKVCWAYQKYSGTAWTTAGGDYTTTDGASATVPGAAGAWMDWTVTNQIQTALDTYSSKYSFIVKDGTESGGDKYVDFTSSEGATQANRPKLVVDYTMDFTVSVSAEYDVAYEWSGTLYAGAANTPTVYYNYASSAALASGWRFQNVTIPQGSTIDAATMDGYILNTANDDPRTTFYCDDVDNAPDFNGGRKITTRTYTGDSLFWSADSLGAGYKTTPDIKTVIDDIITDRAGWVSGNSLVVIAKDVQSAKSAIVSTYNTTPTSRPMKLAINYTAGGGETSYQTLAAVAGSTTTLATINIWAMILAATTTVATTITKALTYVRTLAATVGSTTIVSAITTFTRTLVTAVASIPIIGKMATRYRTLAATEVSVPVFTIALFWVKVLTTTAGSIATLTSKNIWARILATTSVAVVSISTGLTFVRILTVSVVSSVVVATVATYYRVLIATGVSVSSLATVLTRVLSLTAIMISVTSLQAAQLILKVIEATATGVVALTTSFIKSVSLVATEVSSTVLTRISTYYRVLSSTVVSSIGLSRISTFYRTLSTSVVGSPVVTTALFWAQSLVATAGSYAAMVRKVSKAWTVVVVGEPVLTTTKTAYRVLSVVASTVPSFTRKISFTLSATATGVATIITMFIEAGAVVKRKFQLWLKGVS